MRLGSLLYRKKHKKREESKGIQKTRPVCCPIDLGLLLRVSNTFLLYRKKLLTSHHQHIKLESSFTISGLINLEFPAINS